MPLHDPRDEPTLLVPPGPVQHCPTPRDGSAEDGTVTANPRLALLTGASAPPGAQFHPYIVSREIARGGMGVVYAAHDPTFDREVAIKVMHPGQDSARFVVEAQVTAQLPHPGIPPVYALGALPDGRPFLAMKLIRGGTLADAMLHPDASRLLGAFERICETVGFAHARGIVHRDLKPANVMVGDFGEVLVMDWGLAKGVRAIENGHGAGSGAGGFETVAGQVKGTPAYMAPEQARGEPVDVRADVFALGGILAAVLTGQPPFVGTSVIDTVLKAASADLRQCYAHLDACGADPDLVALAKRCLAARPGDRPADGEAVAAAVAAYRAGVDERLRQVERERAVAAARVVEVRKRRRVQLTLAAVVAVVAVGGSGAAVFVQHRNERQREQAERGRQAERVKGLVEALGRVPTPEVPAVVRELQEYCVLRELSALATGRLRDLAGQDIATKPGLHARLALLADEPGRATELAAYVHTCRADELLTVRGALTPHAAAVAPGLWAGVEDAGADSGRRVRTAGALAVLAPDDRRWMAVAPDVAAAAVGASPAEFAVWAVALEPIGGVLVPPLLMRYQATRAEIRSGKLSETGLAAAVTGYEFAAVLLDRYAKSPAELVELSVVSDPRHFTRFAPALRANKAAVVPLLQAELLNHPSANLAVDKLDAALEACGKRRGYAAAALLALGEAESVWPVLAFPTDSDPTARSYLIERLSQVGSDPWTLVARYGAEPDVSARRALLVALGDFPATVLPGAAREAFVRELLVQYREHPDPGLHSAIDWLLRQHWGKTEELATIDEDLASASRMRVVGRLLSRLIVPMGLRSGILGSQLPAPVAARGKDWFVNGQGQTFAVVRGPVGFEIGSPPSEPKRVARNEEQSPVCIPHAFAIAMKEVTVEQFLTFRKHAWAEHFSSGKGTPMVTLNLSDCMEYCNFLSKMEGLEEDQWCYQWDNRGRLQVKPNYLKLRGYRLPEEEEWEYACRAGAVTARHFGRGAELLPRYSWFQQPTEREQAQRVGRLRPNDLGLFDALGNALEWTTSLAWTYGAEERNDTRRRNDPNCGHILRGGSFFLRAEYLRCAKRENHLPTESGNSFGFRPARTMLPD